MPQVILLSGRLCNRKTRLAKRISKSSDFVLIKTSQEIKKEAKKRGLATDRKSLQKLGTKLDRETGHNWIPDIVARKFKVQRGNAAVVVDSVYNKRQVNAFRRRKEWKVSHFHLWAPIDTLRKRFNEEDKYKKEGLKHDDADCLTDLKKIKSLKKDADVRINTFKSNPEDTFIRVASFLKTHALPDIRCVDVVVGGQYGSEGKGHVAGYLAREYDVLLRVGGPNAGHTVSNEHGVFKYHQLPSGCGNTKAEVLIGPGAVLNAEALLSEIDLYDIASDRLYIDPQAMIIEDSDIEDEKSLISDIGSTGSGVGYATARKILYRGSTEKPVRLAKHIPSLRPYVGKVEPFRGATLSRLEIAFQEGKSILLEGTQGSGLSIHHGLYPHVTSRDTNVAGCLAEAGISPSHVRRILLVIRTFPIRVADPDDKNKTSGFIKNETTFEEIAKNANLDVSAVEKSELTTTTKRKRRVGYFDWELFRRSCSLNAPTDIVLTFTDYISSENMIARRFEQLTLDTIRMIEEIERVANAPVSLINTRFPRKSTEYDRRSVIDRRNWRVTKIH